MPKTRNNLQKYMTDTKADSFVIFDVPVLFKDNFAAALDLSSVIRELEDSVPKRFFYGIDAIFVGDFEDFKEKNTNAKLKDGAIYVSNVQDHEDDMVDDIVHEIAHNVELMYGDSIYADGALELEFLGKRKRLFQLLKSEYGEKINSWASSFLTSEYSAAFDEFLYKIVGYPLLTSITMGLFVSPYGTTSLREYFATGFEEYFLKDMKHVKSVSPAVYKKIQNILLEKDEETDENYS